MTGPLARLAAVWDRVVAACDPAARWAAVTHEPLDEEDA